MLFKINMVDNIQKQIHFYIDFKSGSDRLMSNEMIFTHKSTMFDIERNEQIIHTFAISALYFGDLLDKGYNIYLHENNKTLHIKEGYFEEFNRTIRKPHDIKKMWIAGAFNNYFYDDEK